MPRPTRRHRDTTQRRPRQRLLIGYWHDEDGDGYSHPQPLVDPTWEITRRPQIVQYLKSGHAFRGGGGLDYCRCGCMQEIPDLSGNWYRSRLFNGCLEYCDDLWFWPEGLAHYVEIHSIRLPDEFVAHAAGRNFRPAPPLRGLGIVEDSRFWREWCERNAPFAYEPHCLKCTGAPALKMIDR